VPDYATATLQAIIQAKVIACDGAIYSEDMERCDDL
jgi:hypothetical protein